MITAEEACKTVKENIEIESNAILQEINDEIESLIKVVNEPIFAIDKEIVSYAYPLVEKMLTNCGYIVTAEAINGGKQVHINISWLEQLK